MNQQARFPYILRLACIFIVLVLLVTILYYLKVVLVPILFSVLFAVMLYPFSLRLEKWGFAKGLAAFISVFITTVLLGFLVYMIFTQLSTFFGQVPQLSTKLNSLVDAARDFLVDQFGFKKIGDRRPGSNPGQPGAGLFAKATRQYYFCITSIFD